MRTSGNITSICNPFVYGINLYDFPFRFVTILDQLDARVEKFRKDALNLQEKKDYLLMSMDLIKSNEMLQNMSVGKFNSELEQLWNISKFIYIL